jgi:hypothetical protein
VESGSIELDPLLAIFSGRDSRVCSARLERVGWVPAEQGVMETVYEDVVYSIKVLEKTLRFNRM